MWPDLRRLYKLLDKHPRVEAALEVSFNVIVGFAPFFIISLAKTSATANIVPMFWSFFSSGELVISLFSTCAAVLWVTFLKPQKVNSSIAKIIVMILVILGILFSGVVIGDNIGFEERISEFNQNKILVLYVISLMLWFAVSISNTASRESHGGDPALQIDKKYHGRGA